ncbi:sensor histidine kinase [Microbacterium sp. ASV49]|uniref:Histidine kinase n=1 Tax=Microbacterium candidum TaxID=3041922 RepID=A0ABT7MTZ1_9MICO|nr:ATP-binding protein [Microbacterium sp. ASV49]MDL9977921.1 histidine kinase [Microbacterium sp. ASV49]
MTPDVTSAPRIHLPAMDLAVDIGFFVLLIVSGARYFSHHPLRGDAASITVLVLAIGAGVSYAVAVIGPHRAPTSRSTALREFATRQGIGLLAATAFWIPLTILAPSFGWCAFALFFAVHRVLRGPIAYVVSSLVVIAVSIGLFIMSEGEDLGLVLGPFFGGLVLTYAYAALDRAISSQRALIAELLDTREQLARSERDAGALAERNRVASELHDTVVQRTASALLLLEADDQRPGGSSAVVVQAREGLREALVETRQLLHGLADAGPATESLPALLASQAAAAGAGFAIVGEERAVPGTVTQALQRVVQESLINIAKHADAETVRVTLTYFPDAVGIDVSDDGVGFAAADKADDADGFGIRAMTWRIQNLGGELTIESRTGGGTVVAASVPTVPSEGAAP